MVLRRCPGGAGCWFIAEKRPTWQGRWDCSGPSGRRVLSPWPYQATLWPHWKLLRPQPSRIGLLARRPSTLCLEPVACLGHRVAQAHATPRLRRDKLRIPTSDSRADRPESRVLSHAAIELVFWDGMRGGYCSPSPQRAASRNETQCAEGAPLRDQGGCRAESSTNTASAGKRHLYPQILRKTLPKDPR